VLLGAACRVTKIVYESATYRMRVLLIA
jgi:hypothetical protein